MDKLQIIRQKIKTSPIFFIFLLLVSVIAICIVSFAISTQSVYAEESRDFAELKTTSFNLPDNTDYTPNVNSLKANPLGDNYAIISIDAKTTTGRVERVGNKNGVQSYGVNLGAGSATDNSLVNVNLRYRYNTTTDINGTGREISEDTALRVVNETVGIIKTGALIISKSYNGIDWSWQKSSVDGVATNFHTTDFTKWFKPSDLNGEKLTIYTPSGDDINSGVYIRIRFAYELKHVVEWEEEIKTFWGTFKEKKSETKYENILEETVFYLANNSGSVTFKNASVDDGENGDGMSEAVKSAGTIRDGHGSLSGFRFNKSTSSYSAQYYFQSPDSTVKSGPYIAKDGEFFSDTGRYDFEVTTSLGDVRKYSIYVNTMDVNSAARLYFGSATDKSDDRLITTESKRVFSTTDDIPVYVAGATYYRVNALSSAYMPVIGKIRNTDTGSEILIDYDNQAKSGTISEAGTYEAEFYSNKDYNGDMSGDAYHFIFKFKVIDPQEVPGAVVNGEMLNSMTSFSDFQSYYYGVTFKSLGDGNITYAFASCAEAYNFSWNYQRGLIDTVGDKFIYQGVTYDSQFAVTQALDEFVKSTVELKHFDASDKTTCLTLADITDNVLNLRLNYNIVVFSDEDARDNMKGGEPFFNDRKFYYVDANGDIVEETVEFQFISVSNYESDTVKLYHENKPNTAYEIPYGVSVEQKLAGYNAPSGRYRVVETTSGGYVNEYYGIYIAKGDVNANLSVAIFNGSELEEQTLNKGDNELRQSVRGFILRGANSANDEHSIVKVIKNNDLSSAVIYSFSEIDDIYFNEKGDYTIYIIDRLGNSIHFYFEIVETVPVITVSFDIDDIEAQKAFVGQTISLKTPTDPDDMHEFVGWQHNGTLISDSSFTVNADDDVVLTAKFDKVYVILDFDRNGGSFVNSIKARVGTEIVLPAPTKNGKIIGGFKDQYGNFYKNVLFIDSDKDLKLTAVWYYPNVEIKLYDGKLNESLNGQVDGLLDLESYFPTKAGFEFVGWYYSLDAEHGRFYYGQITSVPNVENMRLDAVWKKSGTVNPALNTVEGKAKILLINGTIIDSFEADYGAQVNLTSVEEDGMSFFGWQLSATKSAGTIYTAGKISAVPEIPQIPLYALFTSSENKESSAFVAPVSSANSTGTTGNGLSSFIGSLSASESSALFGSILFACLLAVLVLILVPLRKGREQKGAGNLNTAAKKKAAIYSETLTPKHKRTFKNPFKRDYKDGSIAHYRGFWKSTPVIALLLVAVMAFMGLFQKFPAGAFSVNKVAATEDSYTYETYVEQYDDPKYELTLPKKGESTSAYLASVLSDNVSETHTLTIADDKNLQEVDELGLTKEETFLLTYVITDLMAFGYDVIFATAELPDGSKIEGLAFTDYNEIYENDEDNGKIFFGCGFVGLPNNINEPRFDRITEAEALQGIKIIPTSSLYDDEKKYGFILSVSEEHSNYHFIVYDSYITYNLNEFGINYTINENKKSNYDLTLGVLYNYDLDRIIYEPNLGKKENLNAIPINASVDYEMVLSSFRSYINEQNKNGFQVDTMSGIYISMEAYNEFLLNNQDESFLGVDAEDIYQIESELSATEYYYVLPDGTLQKGTFPEPTPDAPSFWDRFAAFALAATMVIVGVVILVVTTPCGGAANPAFQALAGACFGAGFEIFSQALSGKGITELNWLKVGVGALSGALSALPIPGAGTIAGKVMGYVVAGLIGGATDAAMMAIDGGSWQECLQAFGTGALKAIAIRGATQVIGKVASKLGCFVAGTAVMTASGAVAIENIKKGTLVASHNDTLGIVEYKPVTEVYSYQADELTHLNLDDGQEIVSTPNHPFYVVNSGYIRADQLRAGDILLLVNGKKVVVEQVQHEILESPVTVYNLEVEGNHNYYAAENSDSANFVLVHNKCGEGLSIETNDWGKQHGCDEHWNAITQKANELKNTGNFEKIYVNKSLKTAGLAGNQRPDIIAIGKNGVASEIWEFASPSQASESMFNKLSAKFDLMLKNNPTVGGGSDVIPWERVLGMFAGK